MSGAFTMANPVVLRDLLRDKHWQTYTTFCREYDRSARKIDPTYVGTYPSRAQLHRWQSGDLKGLPYPQHCEVLEEMFPGVRAVDMFVPSQRAGDEVDGPHIADAPHVALGSCADIKEASSSTGPSLPRVPHSFSAKELEGFWLTCFEFRPEELHGAFDDGTPSHHGTMVHADVVRLAARSGRHLYGENFVPEPRTEGRSTPFRNEIEFELAGRHLLGYWKNANDARYFGCAHLAALSGERVLDGHYTGLYSDVEVETNRWRWVRLDDTTLDPARLADVALKEPKELRSLIMTQTAHDAPLKLVDIDEVLEQ